MPLSLDVLNTTRINARVRAIDDARNTPPRELMWSRRIPDNNNVLDSDIMMRFQGRLQIADLIAEDSSAVTYKVGKFQLETNGAPKIKLGIQLSESELKALCDLGNGTPVSMVGMDSGGLVNGLVDAVLTGLSWRSEALRIAMLLDGFSYDRLGIKITNMSWGMPSDLKVTPATPWTTSASATPVADILGVKEVAMVKYGLDLNRMTMSMQAFRAMIACAEFQAKAKLFIASPYDIAGNLTLTDYGTMRPLAEKVIGMTIEFNDYRYWSTDSTGARESARFMPIEKVILTDSSYDGRSDIWDFANGMVMESLFLGMPNNSVIGSLPSAQRGPLSYCTFNPTLNPPDLTIWGVKKGFPRRMTLQSNAYLSVGSLTDSIAVTDPF